MNRMLKFGLTAIALAAVAPAYAEDIEEEEPEGPIGWTPVAIGLAESPVRGREKGNVEYLSYWRKGGKL